MDKLKLDIRAKDEVMNILTSTLWLFTFTNEHCFLFKCIPKVRIFTLKGFLIWKCKGLTQFFPVFFLSYLSYIWCVINIFLALLRLNRFGRVYEKFECPSFRFRWQAQSWRLVSSSSFVWFARIILPNALKC